MQWDGRVTDREGDIITAFLAPSDHEGPEVLADFSLKQCGIDAEPGDLLIVTPDKVTVRDLGVWTQQEIDEIKKRAHDRWLRMQGLFG